MSLDKAIEYQKEKRKQYHGNKAVSKSCRNHGTCDWCKNNRLYKRLKKESAMLDEIKEVDKYTNML